MSDNDDHPHLAYRFDIWDSIPLREMFKRADHPWVLFGDNCGRPKFQTNVFPPNTIHAEWDSAVTGIGARTNILPNGPCRNAFTAWTYATTATIVLNSMPVLTDTLNTMLNWMSYHLSPRPEDDTTLPREAAYLARGAGVNFAALPPERAAEWLMVATRARRLAGQSYRFIVPQRAPIRIVVETDRRALGALLEVMVKPAPEALLWFHFTGTHLNC